MNSDQELIQLVNEGDEDAFEVLYQRYKDWVCRLAWRFTGNRQDTLDVLQETFTYLLGKFPGFSLTASMKTFLYPVVKHISLTIRSKSHRFSNDGEVFDEIIAPAMKENHSSRSELTAVLAVLPDEQREVLLMRFFDCMSLQDIAAAIDIPAGTVKSRLHHALQRLRNDRRTKDYFFG